MATVHEMDHPLIKHKLALMRDKTTGVKEFREAAAEIAMLMCYEATRDLPLKEITIETPVAEARVQVISGKKIALVPIRKTHQADEPHRCTGRRCCCSEGASGR